MLYLDTSILAAYYCPEPLSDRVERLMLKSRDLAISSLTEVEMASAIARKVREKNVSLDNAHRILDEFQAHLHGSFFKRIAVESKYYKLAYNWITRFDAPLRTFDALHLAIASDNKMDLITADKSLSQSARKLGIPANLIG